MEVGVEVVAIYDSQVLWMDPEEIAGGMAEAAEVVQELWVDSEGIAGGMAEEAAAVVGNPVQLRQWD